MKAFRIVLKQFGATPKEAFGGKSGFSADGRWHSRGRNLDYAAESRSLATLERLVHYKRFNKLAPHVIYVLNVPDAQIETVLTPPTGWDGEDLLPAAQTIGDRWYDSGRSPALQVPSAVTPGETNLVLNSRHPHWSWKWVVAGPDDFKFEARILDLLP